MKNEKRHCFQFASILEVSKFPAENSACEDVCCVVMPRVFPDVAGEVRSHQMNNKGEWWRDDLNSNIKHGNTVVLYLWLSPSAGTS